MTRSSSRDLLEFEAACAVWKRRTLRVTLEKTAGLKAELRCVIEDWWWRTGELIYFRLLPEKIKDLPRWPEDESSFSCAPGVRKGVERLCCEVKEVHWFWGLGIKFSRSRRRCVGKLKHFAKSPPRDLIRVIGNSSRRLLHHRSCYQMRSNPWRREQDPIFTLSPQEMGELHVKSDQYIHNFNTKSFRNLGLIDS